MDTEEHKLLSQYLKESLDALSKFAEEESVHSQVIECARAIAIAIRNGNKVLIAGNGGSAGDAQHIAGELVSRLFFDHAPLPAIALTTDTSVLTAIANDYGYEQVFERQIRAVAKGGDVFVAISTSGRSPNILRGLQAARERDLITIGFTGAAGGPMNEFCDLLLRVPSEKTAVIQQVYMVAGHLICGLVEEMCFPRQYERPTAR